MRIFRVWACLMLVGCGPAFSLAESDGGDEVAAQSDPSPVLEAAASPVPEAAALAVDAGGDEVWNPGSKPDAEPAEAAPAIEPEASTVPEAAPLPVTPQSCTVSAQCDWGFVVCVTDAGTCGCAGLSTGLPEGPCVDTGI